MWIALAIFAAIMLMALIAVGEDIYTRLRIGDPGWVWHKIYFHRNARYAKRVGCDEGRLCKTVRVPHKPCVGCGVTTCNRGMRTDPVTLRRRMAALCGHCHWVNWGTDQPARARRRRLEWEKNTTPVRHDLLETGRFVDQYEGRTRQVLRAFATSDEEYAVVADVSVAALNSSITTLALDEEMYAEERDGETYLRRLPVRTSNNA